MVGLVAAGDSRLIDAEVADDLGVGEDLDGIEALLVDEDRDEIGPDEVRGPCVGSGWRQVLALVEEEERSAGDGGDGGQVIGCDEVRRGNELEFGAEERVELADGVNVTDFVVGEGDGEDFFAAEDEFYGVEAHGGRQLRLSGILRGERWVKDGVNF